MIKINKKLFIVAIMFVVLVVLVIATILVFLNSANREKARQEAIIRLSNTLTNPYSIKDGKIYYQNTLMEDVDVITFEVLTNRSFSKDKNHVYYVTTILEGVDAPTFEFFYKDFLARDKNKVYRREEPINGSDPRTFALIEIEDYMGYGKDKNHVFLGTEIVQGADPATFKPIGIIQIRKDEIPYTSYGTYSKDAKSIYFKTEAVPNSDPATFEPFLKDDGYTLYLKDKNLVYHFMDGVLQGSDPKTFEMLRSGYAHDAQAVYYTNKSMPLADLATFRVLGDGYAEDKNYLYESGEIVFDLSKAENPFKQGAARLKEFVHRDDTAIDVIVATYYDLTLYYGDFSEYSIFDRAGEDFRDFFYPFFKGLKRLDGVPEYEAFRLAFIDPESPAFSFELPPRAGAAMGGEVVGRKFIDSDTMLVYTRYGWQAYLGPSAYMCKESGDIIDKFIFKRVNGEWKIWEIEEKIDGWKTNNEGTTKEECKEINQEKIEKYRIGQ